MRFGNVFLSLLTNLIYYLLLYEVKEIFRSKPYLRLNRRIYKMLSKCVLILKLFLVFFSNFTGEALFCSFLLKCSQNFYYLPMKAEHICFLGFMVKRK